MMPTKARLQPVELPAFGVPTTEPQLSAPLHEARLERLHDAMAQAGLDALVVFGDREHVANIAWLTGYDPRFEEAICVVVPGRRPTLFAGNEGLPYSDLAPLDVDRVLWQPLSLMGQPRDKVRPLGELLTEAGLSKGMRIGIAGWKGYETEEGVFDPDWLETPDYLVKAARSFGPATNAALLFMHPQTGLRIHNEVDQLARFEFAATLSSEAVKRVVLAARPGLTEYDLGRAVAPNGFMQSTHLNLCSGPRAKYGLPSPSFRTVELGDPIVVGVGLMGALNCRAGFFASGPDDLAPDIRDYVDRLVAPYFEAAAAWYEALAIGATGGDLWSAVMSRVGDPFFGIGLNPGHYIHLDEWVHSPVRKGSTIRLMSGMALQCDIIPATGTAYFMTNIEDGIALLDERGRDEFAGRHPEAWGRIQARRAFMTDVLGIRLRPEVLPFSNMAGWLPPFWLDPSKAMTLVRD